jgi:hypothetical protein
MDVLDPIGSWRNEFSLAKIESLIVNIVNVLYHKEGSEPVSTTPFDFMIKWGEKAQKIEPKQQSIEEMKKVFQAIADANKRVKKEVIKRPPPKKRSQ